MDRISPSEGEDCGSIPHEGTEQKTKTAPNGAVFGVVLSTISPKTPSPKSTTNIR
jgi:hypothetical protein